MIDGYSLMLDSFWCQWHPFPFSVSVVCEKIKILSKKSRHSYRKENHSRLSLCHKYRVVYDYRALRPLDISGFRLFFLLRILYLLGSWMNLMIARKIFSSSPGAGAAEKQTLTRRWRQNFPSFLFFQSRNVKIHFEKKAKTPVIISTSSRQ